MTRFHITAKGDAGVCKAEIRGCPLGGESDHYDSAEEARSAFEASQGSTWAVSAEHRTPEDIVRAQIEARHPKPDENEGGDAHFMAELTIQNELHKEALTIYKMHAAAGTVPPGLRDIWGDTGNAQTKEHLQKLLAAYGTRPASFACSEDQYDWWWVNVRGLGDLPPTATEKGDIDFIVFARLKTQLAMAAAFAGKDPRDYDVAKYAEDEDSFEVTYVRKSGESEQVTMFAMPRRVSNFAELAAVGSRLDYYRR